MQDSHICPICNAKSKVKHKDGKLTNYYPFCSLECKNRDLSRWVFENYRIPVSGISSSDNSMSDNSVSDSNEDEEL